MTNTTYRILQPLLAIAGFSLWAYLLIAGRQLGPVTTLSILLLILACAGFAQLAGDITSILGGSGGR